MKPISQKIRKARNVADKSLSNHMLGMQVMAWMRKYGVNTDEFSAWNFDTGVCYHEPTQTAVNQLWTEQNVREFAERIVVKPT